MNWNNINDVDKLADVDVIMTGLSKSKNKTNDLLKAGKLMHQLRMIKDESNLLEIKHAYLKSMDSRLKQAGQKMCK